MATLQKVISGGQTGVDRAALDAAHALGWETGGFCPRGRRAEDGPIPERYPLRETDSAAYAERTRRNVAASDATLVLSRHDPKGGTALTVAAAREAGVPCRCVRLPAPAGAAEAVAQWLAEGEARVLNVAGPRASKEPEVYAEARAFVRRLLVQVARTQSKHSSE